MTLSFQTHFGKGMGLYTGKPTCFIEKIWNGFIFGYDLFEYPTTEEAIRVRQDYMDSHYEKFNNPWDLTYNLRPKYTSIRHDPHDRWKPGIKIHMVVYNRTKNRFQFAPVVKCKGIQKIEIRYTDIKNLTEGFGLRIGSDSCVKVFVDGKIKTTNEILTIAGTDGFDSVGEFVRFFNTDFSGKIIHWTDLKY